MHRGRGPRGGGGGRGRGRGRGRGGPPRRRKLGPRITFNIPQFPKKVEFHHTRYADLLLKISLKTTPEPSPSLWNILRTFVSSSPSQDASSPDSGSVSVSPSFSSGQFTSFTNSLGPLLTLTPTCQKKKKRRLRNFLESLSRYTVRKILKKEGVFVKEALCRDIWSEWVGMLLGTLVRSRHLAVLVLPNREEEEEEEEEENIGEEYEGETDAVVRSRHESDRDVSVGSSGSATSEKKSRKNLKSLVEILKDLVVEKWGDEEQKLQEQEQEEAGESDPKTLSVCPGSILVFRLILYLVVDVYERGMSQLLQAHQMKKAKAAQKRQLKKQKREREKALEKLRAERKKKRDGVEEEEEEEDCFLIEDREEEDDEDVEEEEIKGKWRGFSEEALLEAAQTVRAAFTDHAFLKGLVSSVRMLAEAVLDDNEINPDSLDEEEATRRRKEFAKKRVAACFALRLLHELVAVGYEDKKHHTALCSFLIHGTDLLESLDVILLNSQHSKLVELASYSLSLATAFAPVLGKKRRAVAFLNVANSISKIIVREVDKEECGQQRRRRDWFRLSAACSALGSLSTYSPYIASEMVERGLHRSLMVLIEERRRRPTFDLFVLLAPLLQHAPLGDLIDLIHENDICNLLARAFREAGRVVDRYYPVLISMKVLMSRFAKSPHIASRIVDELMDESCIDRLFATANKILAKRKENPNDPRSTFQSDDKHHGRKEQAFAFPALISVLNALFELVKCLDRSKYEATFAKLKACCEKNVQLVGVIEGLGRAKPSKFSARTIFFLFAIVVVLIVLAPIIFRLIRTPPIPLEEMIPDGGGGGGGGGG